MTQSGYPWYEKTPVLINEEYTISIDIKADEEFTPSDGFILLDFFDVNDTRVTYQWFNGNFTTEWVRKDLTFSVPNNSNIVAVAVGFRNNSNKHIYFKHLKIEKGNKPTDWTPAPEDIENTLEENYYTKTETTSQINQKADEINEQVETIKEDLSTERSERIQQANQITETVTNEIENLQETVETIQSSTDYAINIVENIQANGISEVTTTTGFTFNEEGLTIEKTGANTKTIVDETGLDIKDATGSSDDDLLFAGYDETTGETIVRSKNMTVEKYFVIGSYSRFEDYEDEDGNLATGVFWIGG